MRWTERPRLRKRQWTESKIHVEPLIVSLTKESGGFEENVTENREMERVSHLPVGVQTCLSVRLTV